MLPSNAARLTSLDRLFKTMDPKGRLSESDRIAITNKALSIGVAYGGAPGSELGAILARVDYATWAQDLLVKVGKSDNPIANAKALFAELMRRAEERVPDVLQQNAKAMANLQASRPVYAQPTASTGDVCAEVQSFVEKAKAHNNVWDDMAELFGNPRLNLNVKDIEALAGAYEPLTPGAKSEVLRFLADRLSSPGIGPLLQKILENKPPVEHLSIGEAVTVLTQLDRADSQFNSNSRVDSNDFNAYVIADAIRLRMDKIKSTADLHLFMQPEIWPEVRTLIDEHPEVMRYATGETFKKMVEARDTSDFKILITAKGAREQALTDRDDGYIEGIEPGEPPLIAAFQQLSGAAQGGAVDVILDHGYFGMGVVVLTSFLKPDFVATLAQFEKASARAEERGYQDPTGVMADKDLAVQSVRDQLVALLFTRLSPKDKAAALAGVSPKVAEVLKAAERLG